MLFRILANKTNNSMIFAKIDLANKLCSNHTWK